MEPEGPPLLVPTGETPAEAGPHALTETADLPPVEKTETAELPPVDEKGVSPAAIEPPADLSPKPSPPRTPPLEPLDTGALVAARREPPQAITAGKAPPRRRKWLRAVAVILGVLLGVAVALALIAPSYLRGRIEDEARARGIGLTFGDVDYGFSQITLHDVKLSLAGVRNFEGAAALVEVQLEDWQPRAISATGLSLSLSGTDVLDSLGAWKSAHAAALAAPFKAEGARIEWRPARGSDAALVFAGAQLAVDGEKGAIEASSAQALGRDAGPVNVAWTMPADGFVVAIRPSAPPFSAVHAEIRSAVDAPQLKLVLERTALAPLQSALGIPKGSEGILADGELTMPLPSFERPGPVDGTLRITLKGYVPPHPRDLDGIVFGDTTVARLKFQLAADFSGAKLTSVATETGALALTGSGNVVRDGFDAKLSLKLKGSIPCTALAASAAVARLGRGLGGIAGSLAAGALRGNVGVDLSVEARASDLKSAKIAQSARIGCKVVLPGLPAILFD